jgi:putative methyltransferase
MTKKKVVLYVPDSTSGVYLPLLWASAKSYYEIKGQRPDDYEWVHPRLNYEFDNDKLKEKLLEIKPDVFGISMYIWNDVQCLEMGKWVKETFPNCLVLSGGPQQYFKHDMDWFKTYPFIDASLDGGEYGELTIADVLDNLKEDNTVDWNLVREVVYPSKARTLIKKSKKTTAKKDFFWNYSPFGMQRDTILQVAHEIQNLINTTGTVNTVVQGKIETTRGCPYSCAFCDWGGGIGSKVIQKDLEYVFEDIRVVEECDAGYVFLCDANFGILGDRDLSIIKYMAERKQKNPNFFHLYFGGFAKTEKHTETIKDILDIDAQNNLTWDLSYKASIQSIHQDVLDNIKRSDIPFEKHVYLANHLKKFYGFSSYAECISGLPGITVDKWYHEINVYTENDMDICLYNWHLLPETPSYDYNFRKQMGMKTVNKYSNMQSNNSTLRKSEVVVETYSYTKEDYKEMWMAFTIQRGFWATGVLEKTINKIFKTSNIGYGDFVKKFYQEFLRSDQCGPSLKNYIDRVDHIFKEYYDDDSTISNTALSYEHTLAPLYSTLVLEFFYNLEENRDYIRDWLVKEFPYLNPAAIDKEFNKVITVNNIHTSNWKGLKYTSYSNDVVGHLKSKRKQVKGRCFQGAVFDEKDTGMKDVVDFLMTQMETYTKVKFLIGRSFGV